MSKTSVFVKQVTALIKSKEAKESVALELDQHLKASVQQRMEKGLSPEEAEKQAIQDMGDPVQLGIKMGKLHRPKVDWSLLTLFLLLQLIGFLPLLIANYEHPFSISKKVADVLFGLAIVIILMFFDYRKLKKRARYIWGIACVILGLLFCSKVGGMIIMGEPYIQLGLFQANSIIVIPLLFIGWAGILNRFADRPWMMTGLFFLSTAIYSQVSNLSNVMIYMSMVLAMYAWAIRKKKKLLIGSIAAAMLLSAGSLMLLWVASPPYMKERLFGYLYPESYSDTTGYTPLQIKKYMSEAGWFGQHTLADNFDIPFAFTDTVFVTVTYTFGWMFSIVLSLFLITVTIRMCRISIKTKDPFGQLIIIGGTALYTIPLVYNIGMVLGFLPLAGFYLPFVSYGTVPILINAIIIGLVLSVYRRKDFVSIAEER